MTGMTPTSTAFVSLALGLTVLQIAERVESPPSLMSRGDRAAELRTIHDDGRLALGRCRELEAEERAICRAEARANERIAMAALEARYRGTLESQQRALREQARALHAVAEARRLLPAT